MAKTKMRVYKRQDGRWEGRYTKGRDTDGRLAYGSVYGKSYAEAKQRLLAQLAEGPQPCPPPLPDVLAVSDPSFADVAALWLSAISIKVKPSTFAEYVAILELHILPVLGKRSIRELTATDAGCFAKDKLENGRTDGRGGLSAKTVRDMLSVFKMIMDYAYHDKLVESKIKIAYPKQRQQSMRVLSKLEQVALETVLNDDMSIYKLGILLCLYTGIRIGEAYVKQKLKICENIFSSLNFKTAPDETQVRFCF